MWIKGEIMKLVIIKDYAIGIWTDGINSGNVVSTGHKGTQWRFESNTREVGNPNLVTLKIDLYVQPHLLEERKV